ncbi:hypothetical protein A3D77_07540 [Candidatus Gottesmanbacteria bacterium RIFCSPHIGHO2_02_FULL_39_11]|uniref:Uncharacterized protein n=1 Tax=Candidatus Gottesmanbacteria bacterium RIFCSPHIGHO2_02_FULL_39_11 TaxID=1798382 RepID=A0A1F5ZS98_9BACT|nr:MAG: hypothetical protein A3D77_07540 [Candidatus Gottesmanbacteria bacterium RIFCSPHIGHO2_02_FULL_39_11]
MKLNEKVAAHSLAIMAGAYYIVCASLIYIAPDLYKSIAISWAHGADLSQIWRGSPPEIGTMLWGLVTFTVSAWITGYIFAFIYNHLLKNK